MDPLDLRSQVAVIRATADGACTYCHRRFGDLVYWRGKHVFLGEEADHVIPRVLGGRITVPCCSLCNRIKGSLRFESLSEIQDFLLARLLQCGSFTVRDANEVKLRCVVQRESITDEDIEEVCSEAAAIPFSDNDDSNVNRIETVNNRPRKLTEDQLEQARQWIQARRIAVRTRKLEREYARQEREKIQRPLSTGGRKPKPDPLDAFDMDTLPEPE